MRSFGYYYAISMGLICLHIVTPAMILGAAIHFRSAPLVTVGLIVAIIAVRRFTKIIAQMREEF